MFEFLQLLHIGGLQTAALGFPLVIGGGTGAVFPPDLVDGTAGIGPLEHGHDLRFSELRLTHGNLLAKGVIVPESSPYDLSTFLGSLQNETIGFNRLSEKSNP